MTRDVIIHDIRGRRTCTDADFPLAIGAGPQADIRLPDLGEHTTFAFVARSDAHVFIQPAGEAHAVYHNDERVSESRWLEHGDVLRVAETTLRFEAGATGIAFLVDVEVVPPAVQPPKDPPPVSSPLPDGAGRIKSASRPVRRRLLKAIVSSVFLLLVLITAFVFLATSVSVQVTPAPDRMSIDGALPGFTVGGRLLLIPGEYRVRAEKAGYHALDARVEVSGTGHQVLDFSLEKLPGIVSFEVSPAVAATVSVDGAVLGSTPLEHAQLAPGEHAISIEAPRYAPASMRIEVRGMGERQRVQAKLSPLWAEITIDSRPAGARVLLDGENIGETPLRAEILEGSHRLELTREGFDTVSTALEVSANRAQVLPAFVLVESDGLVKVETDPAGATVTVAGDFRGRTPVELSLAPHARHTLKIAKAGYEVVEREITVAPGASESLTLRLSPRYGSVFITSLPVDAELYVDGQLHGPATGRIRLSTRGHELEIKKAGYESFSTTITPRAGVSQRLSVTLKTVAEAKAAARKPLITTSQGQSMRLLEPARFQMGASRREPGRRANESRRLVELTRPYYLSVNEVSNDEFRQFKPEHNSGALRGKTLNDAKQPVAQVTWEDAVRYLNWLSAKDALPPAYVQAGESFVPAEPPTTGYRLPTEAEWTYAARFAGTPEGLKYPWGNSYPPAGAAGNYADNSASTLLPNTLSDYGDGYPVAAPVGSFAPTGPGFFDLGGNVSEWCQDFYAVYPNAAGKLETDPKGPDSGRHHVVRGSSWRHAGVSELRSSYRDYSEKARDDLGFRIARYAD